MSCDCRRNGDRNDDDDDDDDDGRDGGGDGGDGDAATVKNRLCGDDDANTDAAAEAVSRIDRAVVLRRSRPATPTGVAIAAVAVGVVRVQGW